jgi:hypothetical protein
METIKNTRLQLEALLWLCNDAGATFANTGMSPADVATRSKSVLNRAEQADLLNYGMLRTARCLNSADETVCPLCLEPISATFFSDRIKQAAGRERLDMTITAASMFHIRELRVGEFGHRPYNLGWGHHFCNVVAADAGIGPTLDWMHAVIKRNDHSEEGDG